MEEYEEHSTELEAVANPIMMKFYGAGGDAGGVPGGRMPGGGPGGFPGAADPARIFKERRRLEREILRPQRTATPSGKLWP
jgi:hypothetical protein